MLEQLLDWLFPRVSLDGTPGQLITEEEWASIRCIPVTLSREHLQRDMHVAWLDSLTAAGKYDSSPLLQKAIHRFKYARVPAFGEELGALLIAASAAVPVEEKSVLCPVPLHWTREWHRGFNQSRILAQSVSDAQGIPVVECLRRVQATGHQAHRNARERRASMHGAFAFAVDYTPEHVVLIDDVATTCSTLDACAEVLKSAGVKRVDALVIALG